MAFESISNDAVGRKKRTNRLAKLKQSKLDVRREQWLSQVKSKEGKVDLNGRVGSSLPSLLVTDEGNRLPESLELMPKGENFEGSSISENNLESPMSTPVGSSESSKCGSEIVSEGEEDDDGCLDDWEAVADASTANEKQHNPITVHADPQTDEANTFNKNLEINLIKSESEEMVCRVQENSLAWRPDDVLRPQCLPSLLKQHVTMNSTSKAINRAWQSIISQPTSCPICYEDLDLTDSRFLPCPCGFLLCLFCHQRILEADGRCPGCRKDYEPKRGDVSFNGQTTVLRMDGMLVPSARV